MTEQENELGLPDELPPLRLPAQDDLAAAARDSEVLARVGRLAAWVAEHAPVTEDGDLTPRDVAAAAAAAAVEVTGEPEFQDVPELVLLWDLAQAVDLVVTSDDGEVAEANPDLWPTDDAAEDLGTWGGVFSALLESPVLDADLAGEEDLDFAGVASFVIPLFLARSSGVPVAVVHAMTEELAIEGIADPGPPWAAWVSAHGHPATVLLDRLSAHGAVVIDGDTVRLTPLGLWAMREQLVAHGVAVPDLPPAADMTAAELLLAVPGMTEGEWRAEGTQWLACHEHAELLAAAVAAGPTGRVAAAGLVPAGDPAWQDALAHHELRPYAQDRLGLPSEPADRAWLLVDAIAATADVYGDYDPFVVSDLTGLDDEVFGVAWRLPHPDTYDVLSLLGAHLPDKKLAKAARTAAHKARSAS